MKKIFLLLMVMVYGMTMFAGDIIVTKSSEKINAVILEVSENEVKYKKESNPNGPTFIVSMENIASVIYGNTLQSQSSDLIVTGMDETIEAQIIEVNESEVKYKKINNPNGPTFSISAAKISSILFANGEIQVFSAPSKNAKKANSTSNSTSKLKFNPQPSDNYTVGITFGYVSKNITQKDDKFGYAELLLGDGKHYTPAMQFGLTVNPTFKYGIGVRTGLFMEYAYDTYEEQKVHDIVLSLPLQLSYRYEIIKDFSIMLYTGPVFDFGAFLQRSYTYRGKTTKSENLYAYKDLGMESNKKAYSGFDCLWGIGAGIQWSRLRLDIGGQFGMVNRISFANPDVHTNKPVYVTLTCLF